MAIANQDKPKHKQAAETVRLHLDASALEDANDALIDALERWPHNLRLHMLKGELLERTGETDAARDHYREVQANFSEAPWPNVQLVRLLGKSGELIEALEIFAQRIWPSAVPEKTKATILHGLTSGSTHLEEIEIALEKLIADETHPFLLARLAAVRMARGAPDRAMEALERAANLDSKSSSDTPILPHYAQSLLLDLRIASLQMEKALSLAEHLHEIHPDQPEYAGKLIRVLGSLGETDRAVDLLASALQHWPDDWRFVARFNRLALPPGRDAELFALLQTIDDPASADPRWQFQYALACLQFEQIGRTMEILRGLKDDPAVGGMARPLEAALASRSRQGWQSRESFKDDRSDDVQITRVPGAEATVVVFAGLLGRLAYLPLGCADALFADYPVNVIYLRDLRFRAYLKGVAGLGDSEQDTVSALNRLLQDLGTPKVVTIGASMGGYAAMRYGALIGADAAISLAGTTTIDDAGGDELVESGVSTRFDGFMRLFRTALASDLDGKKSLTTCISEAPSMQVYQCYGADRRQEAAAASRLKHLENVSLVGVSDVDDHFVALHMISRGDLDRLLRESLVGDSPGVGA